MFVEIPCSEACIMMMRWDCWELQGVWESLVGVGLYWCRCLVNWIVGRGDLRCSVCVCVGMYRVLVVSCCHGSEMVV